MAGFETAVSFLNNAFFNVEFAGQTYILSAFIILATLLLITRVWQDWGILLLPVSMGWKYFGAPIPYIFIVPAIIIFVLNVMSLKQLSGVIAIAQSRGRILTKRGRMEVIKEGQDYAKATQELEKETYATRLALTDEIGRRSKTLRPQMDKVRIGLAKEKRKREKRESFARDLEISKQIEQQKSRLRQEQQDEEFQDMLKARKRQLGLIKQQTPKKIPVTIGVAKPTTTED